MGNRPINQSVIGEVSHLCLCLLKGNATDFKFHTLPFVFRFGFDTLKDIIWIYTFF